MKAFLKNYRQSPRKVRLVARLIKGKNVENAITSLDFLVKRAGTPLRKLLLSAVANAKLAGVEVENLYVKEFTVDKGITMKRIMPAAMGSAHRINKRTCNVAVLLAEKVIPIKKATKAKKVTVKKSKK
jgi:large subunit ribosomal protein L22